MSKPVLEKNCMHCGKLFFRHEVKDPRKFHQRKCCSEVCARRYARSQGTILAECLVCDKPFMAADRKRSRSITCSKECADKIPSSRFTGIVKRTNAHRCPGCGALIETAECIACKMEAWKRG